ncbi:WD repeat-containing protein 44, partial [Bonamia ostreae]
GKEVTKIEFSKNSKKILVSTNDDRIRLFETGKFELIKKLKGHRSELFVGGSFSNEEKIIISGSKNGKIYLWGQQKSEKAYESIIEQDQVLTNAIFAPKESVNFAQEESDKINNHFEMVFGEFKPRDKINLIIVATNSKGFVKIFETKYC